MAVPRRRPCAPPEAPAHASVASASPAGISTIRIECRPSAATAFLRGNMGTRLVDAMVPELGQAMRVASDPLVGQAISALAGVDVGAIANRVANGIDTAIWNEIGREEAAIRANPQATRDPLIIGVFGAGDRLL